MNIVDGQRMYTFPPNVHTCHDWGSRTDKLPYVTTISPKLGWIRFEWSYLGWSISGNANRPDCIDVIAGPKFNAG
jgi:hypothetical protein